MVLENEIIYVNTRHSGAVEEFSQAFYNTLNSLHTGGRCTVLLCIGTDRVTGDALGPIIGYKLSRYAPPGTIIYGTLDEPVHAKNLVKTIDTIYANHNNPLVIAIDASLGRKESIGYLTVGEGRVKPGLGLSRDLPEIGDMFITGIVCNNGVYAKTNIQNTRLNIVMRMADIAYYGIMNGLNRLNRQGGLV